MTALATRELANTPIAIIDFETTGLTPGADRVVEVSVVRLDPGKEPRLVFDSLVNPRRRVSGTEIHGITDADVADAPEFGDVAGDFVNALAGCSIAAYNVYFDLGFLESELSNVGVRVGAPHFCLMYMRPMLSLGKKSRLGIACQEHGITLDDAHVAATDAMASARLMQLYLRTMEKRGISTYGELGRLKSYKFVKSFDRSPLGSALDYGLVSRGVTKSRTGFSMNAPVASKPIVIDIARKGLLTYWEALKAAVADLSISDEEVTELLAIREQYLIPAERVRALHARLFGTIVVRFSSDTNVDEKEIKQLRRLRACLSKLGWAPGD